MSAAFPPYDQTHSHSLHGHQGREGEPGGGYLYLPSAVPSAELCGHFSVKNWAVTCWGRRRLSQARSCPSVITPWIWNWDLPVCPMQRTSALTSICPETWWAALTWPVAGGEWNTSPLGEIHLGIRQLWWGHVLRDKPMGAVQIHLRHEDSYHLFVQALLPPNSVLCLQSMFLVHSEESWIFLVILNY